MQEAEKFKKASGDSQSDERLKLKESAISALTEENDQLRSDLENYKSRMKTISTILNNAQECKFVC